MIKIRRSTFKFLAAASLLSLPGLASVVQAQPIKVLFWGGQDNASPPHLPRDMRDTLAPYFAANNIQMSYREAITHSWLTVDSLNSFDVLLVAAANRGSGFTGGSDLTTAQMNALTQWIASGRAMVVLHGSSNAYQSSSNAAWRQLLGASFLDHGPLSGTGNAGTISFVRPGHPAVSGTTLLPASAANAGGSPYWDEGRRHQNFSSDTIVLARSQLTSTVNVPWIWVRPQGNGWVYYNASGHDGETWRRSEWKGQVLQALNWGYQIKTTGIRGNEALKALKSGIWVGNRRLIVPLREAHAVRIHDLAGKQVLSRSFSGDREYDLSALPVGTYSIEILTRTDAFRAFYLRRP